MIKIENYNNINISGITYGGHSGSKKGILVNNEKWFLKYPKSTKNMEVNNLSYTTSPLSEYLGSHIYEIIGIETHETKLGISNNKLVVSCKDFLNKNEILLDYNSIKNDYDENIEKKLEEISSSTNRNETDITELSVIMNNNRYFKKVNKLKERFWDMFIVDALINNNDRNDNNWGLILNTETNELRIPPVYDNGASFYSKSSNEKIVEILKDEFKIKQVIYDSCVCSFQTNNKIINPLKYIEKMEDSECNSALLRIYPKVDIEKIKELFDSIPNTYDEIIVISKEQKELYYKSIVYKYEKVFTPIYNILRKTK